MAHGIGEVVSGDGSAIKINQNNHHQQINHQQALQQQQQQQQQQQHQSGSQSARKNVGVMGSRRIFAAAFKLKVLDSYRNDIDCRGNQRATARKYGIHRRQIQKWLQCEENLRSSCAESNSTTTVTSSGCCTVPVGSGVAASPTSGVVAQGEIASKTDVTTAASSLSSGCASLINGTGNNPNSSGNNNNGCNGIASLGVAVSAGTPIATPAPATAVPALNLSLARLHGDEQQQQHQQHAARPGPPPHLPSVPPGASLRHSVRRASSPTSPPYPPQHNHNSHNHHRVPSSSSPSGSMPLRNMLVGYTDYVSQQEALQHHQQQQQQQSHQRHQRRQQSSERPRHDDEQQQQQQHLHEKLMEDSSRSPERKYSYVINRAAANYDHDIIRGTGSSRSPNSEAYYQTLETYHNAAGFVGLRSNNNNNSNNNNDNNNTKEIGLGGGVSPCYQDNKNNVDSAGNVCEPPPPPTQPTSFASSSSPLLLLHATTIKSERASPDSLATPGPCETPGSPESVAPMPRARLNHHHHHHHQHQLNQQHQQQSPPRQLTDAAADTSNTSPIDVCSTNTRNSLASRASAAATAAAAIATASAAAAAAAAAAVHSNETTSPLAHVHVSVDSHASNARDSENQQREREQHRQQLHRDSVKVEYEERMGRRVKEEIVDREEVETTTSNSSNAASMTTTTTTTTAAAMMMMMREPKREMTEEEALVDRSRYHRERTTADVAASCPDYQGAAAPAAQPVGTPTGLSSGGCSGLASPIARDPAGSYSGLSSPRAASSSGISTSSSCSDSEIDPLDYSSNSARNAISDLSRRRSFSLRFKLGVLDAFHGDAGVAGNQRATARKFGINRRQVQKWLGQESELRGEIALRGGDLRQRLGPMTEAASVEASIPVDLRTGSASNYPALGGRSETELENSSPPLYCCDVGSSSQKLGYYHHGSLAESPEMQPRSCNLSCCVDGLAAASMGCYQESASQRRSSVGYPESQGSLYCYSPRDPLESGSGSEGIDVTMSSSPLKRTACTLTCCYHLVMPSPKRICLESIEEPRSSPTCQGQPPQDAPLCLVKPKSSFGDSPMQTEPVTSTVPTPPAQPVAPPAAATPASKKNAILFKPYLDNPVSKPTDEMQLNHQANHRGLSPLSAQSVIVNNNNNCHGTCNLNEERSIGPNTQSDYALELSLRVPVTWRTHHGGYGEFPERLRSAFVRYPTSPHYT